MKYKHEDGFNMNLQLFADEAQAEAAEGDVGASGGEAPEAGKDGERTFTQAEVDRIINQRFAKLQKDAEARVAQAREEGRSEAEKLAKMTEAQRIEHERERAEQAAKERESALTAREAEITRRELRAEAIDTLISKGLPKELEQLLDYTDADACSTSIDRMDRIFRVAVQAKVDERLSQNSPQVRRSGAGGEAAMLAEMRHAAGLK